MRSFKSNKNIHKKEDGSYYVVSANKALLPYLSYVTRKPVFSGLLPVRLKPACSLTEAS